MLNDNIVVMLDHLEDPHNFGAIIRTCEALGIDAIIIPNDRNVNINQNSPEILRNNIGYDGVFSGNLELRKAVNLNGG